MPKEKRKMKPTVKKALLQTGGFFTSITPIAVLFGLRWDVYTQTTASKVSLAFGGAICVVMVLLKVLNKMPKNIKPIIWYAIAFAVVMTLEPLIQDLKWIIGMAFIGEFGDWALFSRMLTKTQREIDASATTDAMDLQTQKIVDAINGIAPKGRV